MDKFTQEVVNFIRKEELVKEGDRIVVGFSGGADSTALLSVLSEIRRLLGIGLIAVHVNHGLRGEEALRDEKFCIDMAGRLDTRILTVGVDVRAYAGSCGLSEEEAARILRYEALSQKGAEVFGGEFKIAVGHHSLDQAETILLNILRGSGLKGITGMSPRRGNIIRPLLFAGKADILKYLGDKGLKYVTDSTNLSNDHTRNYIRNEILPQLETHVNAHAASHIAGLGEKISLAEEYLEAEALNYLLERGARPESGGSGEYFVALGARDLKDRAKVFRIYVIIEGLKLLGVPMKDLGEKHFGDIDALLFKGKGKRIDLPGDVSAENISGDTLLKRKHCHNL